MSPGVSEHCKAQHVGAVLCRLGQTICSQNGFRVLIQQRECAPALVHLLLLCLEYFHSAVRASQLPPTIAFDYCRWLLQ